MGHRAYLIIRTETIDNELFEANNILPFFWVTLLDQSALAQVKSDWEYASRVWMLDYMEQEKYGDIWPRPTDLVVEKSALLLNIAKAQRLLQAKYPELLVAYQEFTSYLLAQLPGPDDYIHLDVFALAAFTTPAELLQSLYEQLAAIDQQQPEKLGPLGPELVTLTGFPNAHVAAVGSAYPQLQTLLDTPRAPPPSQVAKPKDTPWVRIVLGLLLLFASYWSYQQLGPNWLSGALALFGSLSLVGGIFFAPSKRHI